MFKIESYVTPILLSYVDKYVRDFKPEDAQVSLWGGGVALHNLELKADVLQREVALPFTLVSGRIHELLIQVPWTKIMSEPIVVTIDTIECVLSLNPPKTSRTDGSQAELQRPQMETPPGYMQALVRRIVSNIALKVHHLIVKYVQDDMVLSLNVKHFAVDSAGPNWEPCFADIDPVQPVIRRLVHLDDLTLCLDSADADGKIRFFQEPLLYRCQLDLRVLTRLVSANTRRANSISVQVRSSKLAWSVTSDQLAMLLRLYRERGFFRPPTPLPRPPPNLSSANQTMTGSAADAAEPARSGSWSDWAWSWLPQWTDREAEDRPVMPMPLPVSVAVYLDDMYFAFKVMEKETETRKRPRVVLEMTASHAALRYYICKPVLQKFRFGVRELFLFSKGLCVCGQTDYRPTVNDSVVYLKRLEPAGEWEWPQSQLDLTDDNYSNYRAETDSNEPQCVHGKPEEPQSEPEPSDETNFWQEMAPLVFVDYNHERSPPVVDVNPYDTPPQDFQYSDWVEDCHIQIVLEPVDIRLGVGLFHCLYFIRNIYQELPVIPQPDQHMRTLTIEENDALADNLPQRRVSITAKTMQVSMAPWDHTSERARPVIVFLKLALDETNVTINGPLYPHRVCCAACQIPEDSGPLWNAARLHVTANVRSLRATLATPGGAQAKPCARMDVCAVFHVLLNKAYFTRRESVVYALSLKISEANVCGSTARLQTAYEVLLSLLEHRISTLLRYTSLLADAFADEEAVAIDLSAEDFILRVFMTLNTNTILMSLQSAKATAFHETKGKPLQQAFFFSGPDAPVTTPYFRLMVQYCEQRLPQSLDYIGVWTEPTGVCVDPLLITWLAYKPVILRDNYATHMDRKISSSFNIQKLRASQSSSGRSGSKSAAELAVHIRPRSISSSEKTQETKSECVQVREPWWHGDRLLHLHERLRQMLINVELGLVMLYVTMTSASALDCVTIRDALERHASLRQQVLAFSLGRISMYSCSLKKLMWQDIRHDGPTFLDGDAKGGLPESFPWRLRLADVSCYTLELRESGTRDYSTSKRSQLKTPLVAKPRTVLELVTTTVTLSVVTKSLQIVSAPKLETVPHRKPADPKGQRTKYFTTGIDFKPTTLREFVRGPAHRKKSKEEPVAKPVPESKPASTPGPIFSLGVHLHADTPPLIIRLEQDQADLVATTAHCFEHIVSLVRRPPLRSAKHSFTSLGSAPRSPARSVSEQLVSPVGESGVSSTDEASDLIPLFLAGNKAAGPTTHILKTFFYFQWVVSRVTVVGTEPALKLAFDVDDVIATCELQEHYNQLKVKVASASIRHYKKTDSNEWLAGSFNGRVLEARETANSKAEDHFLCVTLTQARISTLPATWKEELHPKLLEQNTNDCMWEIFATLAPLEMVIEPKVLKQIVSLLGEMAPRSFCPLENDDVQRLNAWQLPFFYVNAGGMRLLLTQDADNDEETDDTIIFEVGAVTANPHPDNPICRRSTMSHTEGAWVAAGGSHEGRQYEVQVKNLRITSAKFSELVKEEKSMENVYKGTDNPALMRPTHNLPIARITPLLDSLDISSVLAPAMYVSDRLTCGPAVELNLVSDCKLQLTLHQLALVRRLCCDIYTALRESEEELILEEREESRGVCPYAALIEEQESMLASTDPLFNDEVGKGTDSGVVMGKPSSRFQEFAEQNPHLKKTQSRVAFANKAEDSSEYLEVFVAMGEVHVSLLVTDDDSPEVQGLRSPDEWQSDDQGQMKWWNLERQSIATEKRRDTADDRERKFSGLRSFRKPPDKSIPLLHACLWQPNFYYWRKMTHKTLQFSIFNAWLGHGSGDPAKWSQPLFLAGKGTCDPITDIPPALLTMKMVATSSAASQSVGGTATRGTFSVDIERPIQVELSVGSLLRLRDIYTMVKNKCLRSDDEPDTMPVAETLHPFYRLKAILLAQSMENVTLSTSQVSFVGSEGAIGWHSSTLQIGLGFRPHRRMCVRALLSAAVVSAGPAGDSRHVLLHPFMIGMDLESNWEPWRHVEGGLAYHEPFTRVCVDMDRAVIDLRPADLAATNRLRSALHKLAPVKVATAPASAPRKETAAASEHRASFTSAEPANEHYYKDDLRSGAFKIVSGGQLPMAYQVTLHDNAVAWRYPYPRAITRLVAFPLPDQDVETPCVLELYNVILGQWEQHTHFAIPVAEPVETQIYISPPDAVFAQIWRYRVYESDEEVPRFVFDPSKFEIKADPMVREAGPEQSIPKSTSGVTTEQLSGVVRVDSCFAPRVAPSFKLVTRVAMLLLYAYNDMPPIPSHTTPLEGYYVSKPLMRNHRVLLAKARDANLHANLASPAGTLIIAHTFLSSDILESSTGTMEQMIKEFRIQAGVSIPSVGQWRTRVALRRVQAGFHVPRLRTLQALLADWQAALNTYIRHTSTDSTASERWPLGTEYLRAFKFKVPMEATALDGRITLWIHNTTSSALKVGQEGTDEVVPLGPGTSLAYRWRFPTCAKRLRFSVAGPTADWHWSNSIPFTVGSQRVRLADAEPSSSNWLPGVGAFLHTSVEEHGARRSLTVAGRLCPANMLRQNLLYKVRARVSGSQWRTICSGELAAECVGNTVICGADAELVFKIKFTDEDMGWTGDIPLKQCPKVNVPWLVKVPSYGDPPYTCVWCRVVRGRSDSRMLVSVWPLYVLYSHLPHDSDVLITSTLGTGLPEAAEALAPAAATSTSRRQGTPGRGRCTHLVAPGTTAARHTLAFQYTDLSFPVTRESIPLHYGVTDTSVFDKRAPVVAIEEVIAEIHQWLDRSSRHATSAWPYSAVTRYWPGQWRPAKLQPRSDVTVRYQAIYAGGGCSLEVQLCPVVMLCNAAPISLTLRSHDAAPLCKLEPGTAITPSSAVLKKPFFLSVEMGRETYVSGQVAVTGAELGCYGKPAKGLLALDHSAELAVLCDHKVALLTMYYEIKEEINVLGITSTYVLINRMSSKILVSAMAVPTDTRGDVELRPSRFKVIEPTPEGSMCGTPLCRFFLVGRWRGGSSDELRLYVTVSVCGALRKAAPLRLGQPPYRRALCVVDEDNTSIPVVITQVKTDGCWMLTVSEDPCPEFVVHNMTMLTYCIAQPVAFGDEPSTSQVTVRPECSGVQWYCTLSPVSVTHYSTPAHCARYPPPANPLPPSVTFLTLAVFKVDAKLEWSSPIAVADGEQLVQVTDGVTVKLRVRTHPHSTVIELKDVDETDISASDIRKRLFGVCSSEERLNAPFLSSKNIERTDAVEKLLSTKDMAAADTTQAPDEDNNQDAIVEGKDIVAGDSRTPLELKSSDYAPVVTESSSTAPGTTALTGSAASDVASSVLGTIVPIVSTAFSRYNIPDVTTVTSSTNNPVDTNAKSDTNSVQTAAQSESNAPTVTIALSPSDAPADSSAPVESRNIPPFGLVALLRSYMPGEASAPSGADSPPVVVEETVTAKQTATSFISKTNQSLPSRKATGALLGTSMTYASSTHLGFVGTDDPASTSRSSLASTISLSDKAPHNPGMADAVRASTDSANFGSLMLFSEETKNDSDQVSRRMMRMSSCESSAESVLQDVSQPDWKESASWHMVDRLRLVAAGVTLEVAAAHDERPLVALHVDRSTLVLKMDPKRIKTIISIANVQIDNLQYESGQFDFAVVASTCAEPAPLPAWLPQWNPFGVRDFFLSRQDAARVLLRLTHDVWAVHAYKYTELTEVEARVGPLALYVEDAYVSALARLASAAAAPAGPSGAAGAAAEEAALRRPLRLRALLLHPLDLTLTLHTAVRMYIALDHSPLTLGAFKLNNVMTSTERLTHALTVHYLSAAILGAGWVVGGLELLGAPGALAARVGGARGGVRGVASAAAAALLRSLSVWAASLARNLDLLAGDEDHSRRAAAARRRPPSSLLEGLAAGFTNFAINILGAVGGLAHHPLLGVAVGETESSATALRRGLVGAFAKPLSATADLLAFAGHGLLTQTGWDPEPQARRMWPTEGGSQTAGWRRDCVRWAFRLAELDSIDGFRVLLDSVPLQLILTHKFLVVADPESERIVEMIDFRFCTLHPYNSQVLELSVTQKRQSKFVEARGDEDDEYEISAVAMARVARYTGSGGAEGGEARVLSLIPTPGKAASLHALLQALVHQNQPSHFSLL